MTDQPTPEATPPPAAAPPQADIAQPTARPSEPSGIDAPGPLVDWTIAEPRPAPGRRQVVYADIPNRVIAYVIDLVAIFVIVLAIALIVGVALAAGGTTTTGPSGISGSVFNVLGNIIGVLLVAGYFLYGWTSRRATIGMRWLGLQIGNASDGATLTIEQSVRRFAVLFGPGIVYELVSLYGNNGLTGLLGIVAFVWLVILLVDTARSPTKQGFHDRFANSLIVKVTRAPA